MTTNTGSCSRAEGDMERKGDNSAKASPATATHRALCTHLLTPRTAPRRRQSCHATAMSTGRLTLREVR